MDEQSLLPSLPPSLAPFAWSAGPRNADLSSRKKAMQSYGRLWRVLSLFSLAQISGLFMLPLMKAIGRRNMEERIKDNCRCKIGLMSMSLAIVDEVQHFFISHLWTKRLSNWPHRLASIVLYSNVTIVYSGCTVLMRKLFINFVCFSMR